MSWKQVSSIIAGILLVGSLITSAFAVEKYFAKSTEVDAIKQQITQQEVYRLQDRLWAIEDRFIGQSIPQDVKDRIRSIKRQIEALKQQLKDKG